MVNGLIGINYLRCSCVRLGHIGSVTYALLNTKGDYIFA